MTHAEQVAAVVKRLVVLQTDAASTVYFDDDGLRAEAEKILEVLGLGGNFDAEAAHAAARSDPLYARRSCPACAAPVGMLTMAGSGRSQTVDLPGRESVAFTPGIGGRVARCYDLHDVTCPARRRT